MWCLFSFLHCAVNLSVGGVGKAVRSAILMIISVALRNQKIVRLPKGRGCINGETRLWAMAFFSVQYPSFHHGRLFTSSRQDL